MRFPRLRAARPWFRAIAAPVLVVLPMVSGCSNQAPTAVSLEGAQSSSRAAQLAAAAPGAFYPLAIGDRWHAAADDYYRIVPTGGDPSSEYRVHTDYNRAMVGTETLFGRPYVLMREDWTQTTPFSEEPWSGSYWTRYRQDGTGLYEADVAATTPPGGLSGPVEAAGQAVGLSALEPLPMSLSERVPAVDLASYRVAWQVLQERAAMVRAFLRRSGSAGTTVALPSGEMPGVCVVNDNGNKGA
jgi:hypothetical protein